MIQGASEDSLLIPSVRLRTSEAFKKLQKANGKLTLFLFASTVIIIILTKQNDELQYAFMGLLVSDVIDLAILALMSLQPTGNRIYDTMNKTTRIFRYSKNVIMIVLCIFCLVAIRSDQPFPVVYMIIRTFVWSTELIVYIFFCMLYICVNYTNHPYIIWMLVKINTALKLPINTINYKKQCYYKDLHMDHVNLFNQNICPICLVDFTADTIIVVTNCQHIFHEHCIEAWGIVKKNCPVCRKNVNEV